MSIKRIALTVFAFIVLFLLAAVTTVYVCLPYYYDYTIEEAKYDAQYPSFLDKDIYVDGVLYDNYFLERPVLKTVSGEFYIPLNGEFQQLLGLRYHVLEAENHDVEEKTIDEILTTPLYETAEYYHNKGIEDSVAECPLVEFKKVDPRKITIGDSLVTNLRCYASLNNIPNTMICKVDSFDAIDLRSGWTRLFYDYEGSGYNLISDQGAGWYTDGEIYYVDTQLLASLGISSYFDQLTGLYFSTDESVPAEETVSEDATKWITGVANYICSSNKKIDFDTAVKYEYIFRHEANVTKVNELTIIGVAKIESRFNSDSVGDGSVGMMQTLTKYAKNYGYEKWMLFVPHYSIELGTKYLMDRYHMFWDEAKMLVAYNKGPASVRAGRTSSSYSDRVLKYKNELIEAIGRERF